MVPDRALPCPKTITRAPRADMANSSGPQPAQRGRAPPPDIVARADGHNIRKRRPVCPCELGAVPRPNLLFSCCALYLPRLARWAV